MDIDDRIRSAAVFGICFLFMSVIVPAALGIMSSLPVASTAALYRNFLVMCTTLALFFATFILHTYGYVKIAAKFDVICLRWAAFTMIAAILLMAAATTAYLIVTLSRLDPVPVSAFSALAFTSYAMTPAIVGFCVLPLRRNFGMSAVAPALLGASLSIYGLYILGIGLSGTSSPEFLGKFVWLPIPEALFVLSGLPLFFRACKV